MALSTIENKIPNIAPSYKEIASALSPDQTIALYNASWQDYEEIGEVFDEARGFRLTYNDETLKIMTLSVKHEHYAELVKLLVAAVSRYLNQRILFFGSATMKKHDLLKGSEPDASFFVSRADLVSGNLNFDIGETPPDIVVEIDIYHTSEDKFEIYSAFGVSEFWLYDEKSLKIYRLENGEYQENSASIEIPSLTAEILTEYLNRSQSEDQFDVLQDFEKRLKENN